MGANRYVALLRGINVGGRNKVPMADLREAFESAGYGDVGTYIQSGNVVFSASTSQAALEGALEPMLEARFGVPLVLQTPPGAPCIVVTRFAQARGRRAG